MDNKKEYSGKYLTFKLGHEEYGLPIARVKEIIGMMEIVHVPFYSDDIQGVINLRDRVIPVFDMRRRFQMEEAAYNERTCIIIVEQTMADRLVALGMVVDSVSEVVAISGEQVDDQVMVRKDKNSTCINGIAKVGGGVKILLDPDQIFADQGLEALSAAA